MGPAVKQKSHSISCKSFFFEHIFLSQKFSSPFILISTRTYMLQKINERIFSVKYYMQNYDAALSCHSTYDYAKCYQGKRIFMFKMKIFEVHKKLAKKEEGNFVIKFRKINFKKFPGFLVFMNFYFSWIVRFSWIFTSIYFYVTFN